MQEDQLKWRLPDTWTVTQSNGWRIRIDVSQDANLLSGTTHGSQVNQSSEMAGVMSGSIEGDAIDLTIYWPDKTIAEFNGTVSGIGRAEGTTISQPGASSAEWYAEPAMSAWA